MLLLSYLFTPPEWSLVLIIAPCLYAATCAVGMRADVIAKVTKTAKVRSVVLVTENGHLLPALTDNWTHGAASRHTIAPISHTRLLPRSRSYYSFSIPLRVGG